MLRLFIAMPLPHEVERSLDRLLSDLRPRSTNVKWVTAKNIHLTLKFLGDTDEALVPTITSAIDQAATPYQPFRTTLNQVGAFPNLRRPRVFWVGGSGPIPTATPRNAGHGGGAPEAYKPVIPDAGHLARDIDQSLNKLGFDLEKRPFKPHLTLGRVRQGRRVDDLADYLQTFEPAPIPLTLDRIVLFKSTLTPQGAIYERLHETNLGDERFGG